MALKRADGALKTAVHRGCGPARKPAEPQGLQKTLWKTGTTAKATIMAVSTSGWMKYVAWEALPDLSSTGP